MDFAEAAPRASIGIGNPGIANCIGLDDFFWTEGFAQTALFAPGTIE
jgi:hypothetical protein